MNEFYLDVDCRPFTSALRGWFGLAYADNSAKLSGDWCCPQSVCCCEIKGGRNGREKVRGIFTRVLT
jgi:hypothetical protein